MASTQTTSSPPETDSGLQSVEVEEIPADLAATIPIWVNDMEPLFDRTRDDIKRPSLVGNLVFIVSMVALGLWGAFLILYLLKSYLGIDVLESVSLSRALGV
jgi:hypothetical protein